MLPVRIMPGLIFQRLCMVNSLALLNTSLFYDFHDGSNEINFRHIFEYLYISKHTIRKVNWKCLGELEVTR